MGVNKNASVSTVPPPNQPPPRPPPTPQLPTHSEGIRVRGVPESTSKLAVETNKHNMSEIKEMLTFMPIECQISKLKMIGEYHADKTRTMLFFVTNKYQRRLILLRLYR